MFVSSTEGWESELLFITVQGSDSESPKEVSAR